MKLIDIEVCQGSAGWKVTGKRRVSARASSSTSVPTVRSPPCSILERGPAGGSTKSVGCISGGRKPPRLSLGWRILVMWVEEDDCSSGPSAQDAVDTGRGRRIRSELSICDVDEPASDPFSTISEVNEGITVAAGSALRIGRRR